MNDIGLRKLAAVTVLLAIALCSSVACTPEQQLLLTAVDKIYSEVNGVDKNDETAEGSTVPAPDGDDSSVVHEVSD